MSNASPKVFFLSIAPEEDARSLAEKTARLLAATPYAELVHSEKICAIKQHFGEKGNKGFIDPVVTKTIVDLVKSRGGWPLLVETNTLYRGQRSDSYHHLMLAHQHGFGIEQVGAPIVIMDGVNGQNQQPQPIPGKHFNRVYVVSDLAFFDTIFVLTHVKGHMAAGMGGAIKNLGMGFASRAGKLAQHADFRPEIDEDKCISCGLCASHCPTEALTFKDQKLHQSLDLCVGCGECHIACRSDAISFKWGAADQSLQEKMAEHALGAVINHSGRAVYLNFFYHVTQHCDCWGQENPIRYPDLGILASIDPVAIDRASYDLALEFYGKDIFQEFWPKIDPLVQIKHGEKIGLGSQNYELTKL